MMMMLCRCSSIMQTNKNNDLELVFTSLFLLKKLISKWYFPSQGKVGFFNFTVVFFCEFFKVDDSAKENNGRQ